MNSLTFPNMPKNSKNIIIGLVAIAILVLAFIGEQNAKQGQITQASASESTCSVDNYKTCTIDELNSLVSNLNSQVDTQNQLITDLQANLNKAQTNKTNLENQKTLIISQENSKLAK